MADFDRLALGKRTLRVLGDAGIHTLETLIQHNERELLALSGFGWVSMSEVNEALDATGLALAEDPFAAYVCARHGDRSWDTNLSNLFLCDDCVGEWTANAFNGEPPAYAGQPTGGYCLNCNVDRSDVALRRGTCAAVRTGRAVHRAQRRGGAVRRRAWEKLVLPHAPTLVLEGTEFPDPSPAGEERLEKQAR